MVNVNVTDKATGCITAVKSMEKQQRYHVLVVLTPHGSAGVVVKCEVSLIDGFVGYDLRVWNHEGLVVDNSSL
eukprot:m.120879 g.120879  ORF g.120879 m.120879 type:complete len:73 (+) comp12917_c0_seq4:152-370(+)